MAGLLSSQLWPDFRAVQLLNQRVAVDFQLTKIRRFRTVTGLSPDDPLALGLTGLTEHLIQNQLFKGIDRKRSFFHLADATCRGNCNACST
jgi:hypothetical protein